MKKLIAALASIALATGIAVGGMAVTANADPVTALEPTFTDSVCQPAPATGFTDASYTIPTTAGVQYQVKLGPGTAVGGFVDVSAGLHTVTLPAVATVQAVGIGGVVLSGQTTWGPHQFTTSCSTDVTVGNDPGTGGAVTPKAPVIVSGNCAPPTTGIIDSGYTIIATAGVAYDVVLDGSDLGIVGAGLYPATVGDVVVITATPVSGVTLSGLTQWSHTFVSDCTAGSGTATDVTPALPTFTQPTCSAGAVVPGSYTIPETTGVNYEVSINFGNFAILTANTYPAQGGDTVTVLPIAQPGFQITGGSNGTGKVFALPAGGCSSGLLMAAAPTFTDSICTAGAVGGATEPSYTIPNYDGVTYTVQLNSGNPVVAIPNTYTGFPLQLGDTVVVKASATDGEPLDSSTPTQWTHTFVKNTGGCLIQAPLVEPTFDSTPACSPTSPGDVLQGSYTIPAAEGAAYFVTVDGAATPVLTAAGTYPLNVGQSVDVTITVLPGYQIDFGPTLDWATTIVAPAGGCAAAPTSVTPAAVTFAPPRAFLTCFTGSYTVPATQGVDYEVSVDDGNFTLATSGSHSAPLGHKVTVRAVAQDGYVLSGPTTSWSMTFTSPGGVCNTVVAPVPPTITPITGCDTYGAVVPATTPGVSYTVVGPDATTGLYAVTAAPESGYRFAGFLQVTVYFGTVGPHTQCVNDPAAVTFTQPTCAADGGYTIPSTPGVAYEVRTRFGLYLPVLNSGFHTGNAGDTLQFRAVALPGYTVTGTQTWSATLAPPGNCSIPVQVTVSPTTTSQSCDLTGPVSGFITIPNQSDLTFTIDGTPASAGDVLEEPGTYTVEAVADPGHPISGTSTWSLTVAAAAACSQLPTLVFTGDDGTVLAFTGVDGAQIYGYLAAGLLLLIVGTILVMVRLKKRSA